ncbi:MAG: histidine phosphatase family protein, partial [Candidatus Competibacteraceae bacterium]|nr:histidine phosphatase family protein [Candidatus Competibacteraceae bacterium]
RRPLTEAGRKKMRKGANRLRTQVPAVDLLASSTLVRARETAAIVARAYGDLALLERNDLAPDSEQDSLLSWLSEQPGAVVALVGHEPHLGLLSGTLLTGSPRHLIAFKKGGVACLEFKDRPAPGQGRLRWVLTAGQLRSLKD